MVTEPDPDQGHVDGPAPDEVALVVPGRHGAVLAELAERALDGVAVLIGGRVGDLRADDFARLTGRQAAERYPALRGGAGWCLPLSTGASRFLLPVPDGRRIAMGRVDYLLGELGTLSERTLQLTVADLAASSEAGPRGRGAAVTQTALPGLAVLLGLVLLARHRKLAGNKYDMSKRRRPGRPPAVRSIGRLVVRLAKENPL
jgi:hypothetical protein